MTTYSYPTYSVSTLGKYAEEGRAFPVVLEADVTCSQLYYQDGFVGINLGVGGNTTGIDTSGTEVKLGIEGVYQYPTTIAFGKGDRVYYDRTNQALSNDSTHWWFAVCWYPTNATYGEFKFKFNVNQGSQPSWHTP